MKKDNITITIFTPSYNRYNTLKRLYESIKVQSCKNFEWIIVDDGSTDNTKEFAKNVEREKLIKFTYFYQKNMGKPQAINKGADLANYNYFLCVDSDDFLSNDCIEKITNKLYEITNRNNKNFIGIITPRKNIIKENTDFQISRDLKKTSLQELYFKYKFKGETTMIIKTELLRKYKYPKFKNENFIPETWQYDIFDKMGYWYYLPENICFYEYRNDGYTSNFNKLIVKNIKGFEEFSKQRMKIGKYFISKFKGAVYFNICNFLKNRYLKCVFNKNFIITTLAIIPSIYIFHKKGLRKCVM